MRKYFILLLTTLCILGAETNNKNYVLLISFDGFRDDYISWYDTPNFDQLIANGAKASGLRPVYVSKTFPNHYAIATGMYAENHGLISNEFYDQNRDESYCLCKPETVVDPSWYGGEPIWVTAEKQGVKTASYYWVGSATPIAGVLPSITKTYDESVPFEARVDSVAKWFSLPDDDKPSFISLYFHEPDATGHTYGPESDETSTKVRELDNLLGYILEKMQGTPIYEKLNIIIVSDHGMASTGPDKTIDLSDVTELSYMTQEGYGPYSFFYGDSKNNNKAVRALKKSPLIQAFLKNNIPAKWHYKKNSRIKDILVVADEGYTILKNENPDPEKVSLGNHGFDNYLRSMEGVFIASGPSFKKNYQRGTLDNIHIYPLLAEILEIRPSKNIDGKLSKASDLLQAPKKK